MAVNAQWPRPGRRSNALMARNAAKRHEPNRRRCGRCLECWPATVIPKVWSSLRTGTGAGIVAGLPVSAGLAGTMLSLAAAVGLLGKAARNYSKRGMHATV